MSEIPPQVLDAVTGTYEAWRRYSTAAQADDAEARALAVGWRKYALQQRGDDGEWIAMHEALDAVVTALDSDAAEAPDRAEGNNPDQRESSDGNAECLLVESPYGRRCPCCGEPFHWIDRPTGGWWAHDAHPHDDHDAVAGGPVSPDRAEGSER